MRNGKMDNILKLIVGCLALVGLIVMIVPNSDPLASTKAETQNVGPITGSPSDTNAPPPPPPVETSVQQDPAAPSEFIVDDYDVASFGQPMVDPTPPGQRAQQAQQQQNVGMNNNQIAGGQGNFGQPPMMGADSTGPAGPPPPPPVPGN